MEQYGHTLSSGSDGTKTDRVPEHLGSVPLVVPFIVERCQLLWSELGHLRKVLVTRDQCSPPKELRVLGQFVRVGKMMRVLDDLFLVVALACQLLIVLCRRACRDINETGCH